MVVASDSWSWELKAIRSSACELAVAVVLLRIGQAGFASSPSIAMSRALPNHGASC